ncbi:MAG: class I SAM-dependent methyltransferase [Acidobacteria bacterium]|nr:class I SAM-dependent methyltransferase [Acidobacteriota bacterium]
MRIKRLDILNRLARHFGYQRYLEIGIAGGASFKKVEVPEKLGVDPAWRWWYLLRHDIRRQTSDRFFATNRKTFQLVFIDGLHVAAQAHRDIVNALACLEPGGSILVHDCLPTSREQQIVPRMQASWTGDVWRAFLKASQEPELSTLIFEADRGCGLIRRGTGSPYLLKPPGDFDPLSEEELSWETYEEHRRSWLTFVPPEQTFDMIDRL